MEKVTLGSIENGKYFKHGTVSFKKIQNADNDDELVWCKIRSQEAYVYITTTTLVVELDA